MSTEYSAENQNQYHQTVKQWSTLLDSVLLQHPVKMTLKVVAVFSAICSLQIKKMAIHKKKTCGYQRIQRAGGQGRGQILTWDSHRNIRVQ